MVSQENVGSERSWPVVNARIQQQELSQRFTEWSGLELNQSSHQGDLQEERLGSGERGAQWGGTKAWPTGGAGARAPELKDRPGTQMEPGTEKQGWCCLLPVALLGCSLTDTYEEMGGRGTSSEPRWRQEGNCHRGHRAQALSTPVSVLWHALKLQVL